MSSVGVKMLTSHKISWDFNSSPKMINATKQMKTFCFLNQIFLKHFKNKQ